MATFRQKKKKKKKKKKMKKEKKKKKIVQCCWEEDGRSVILPLWVIDEPPINMQKEMMWQ